MTDQFLLKEEIYKLTLALKVTEERLGNQSREIQAYKQTVAEREKRLADSGEKNSDLEKQLVDERAKNKLAAAEAEKRAEDLQARLREKEREVYILRSRATNGEGLSTLETEKLKLKKELETKFGAEVSNLRVQLASSEAEAKATKRENESLRSQLQDKGKREELKLRETQSRNKNQIEELKEAIENLEVQNLNLKTTIADKDFQIQRLTMEVQGKTETREGQLEALKLQLEKLRKERAEETVQATTEVSKLREEMRRLKLEKDKVTIETTFLQNELKAKNDIFSGAEGEISKLKRERNIALQRVDEAEMETKRLKEELLRKAQKLESIESETKLQIFRERSALETVAEIEKKRAESLAEQLVRMQAESDTKLATVHQQMAVLREELSQKGSKLDQKKSKKSELEERVKRLELENHKLRIENEGANKSIQELEEAVRKGRLTSEESENVKKQAANLVLLHKEIEILNEKLAESQNKVRKLKGKSRGEGEVAELSEGPLQQSPEDQEAYEKMKERIQNELYGYTATRFCDTHQGFVERQMPFTPTYSLHSPVIDHTTGPREPQVSMTAPSSFEDTLPIPMSGIRVTALPRREPSEIRIVDQQNEANFSFSQAPFNQRFDAHESSASPPLLPMKDRLAQMIRSGDYLFKS